MEKEGEDPTAPTTYVGGDVFMRYMERADKQFAAALEASNKRFERNDEKFVSALEAISNLRVELKQEINEIKKDCDTATSKAGEAVQKIEKLEGVVTTLQADLEEKIQSAVEPHISAEIQKVDVQVFDLRQVSEARLDKVEQDATILARDMKQTQESIESLKKGRGSDAHGQTLEAHG